jgi:hypothetical protein
MSPRSVVQAHSGPRSKDAGVVVSVSKEKDADGNPREVTVKWDTDGQVETLAYADLKVLLAH